jgi:hypothetical protein
MTYSASLHQIIIRMIKSKRARGAGHISRMGDKRNMDRISMEKPEGKRPLGRPTRKWWTILKWILEQ